MTVGEVLANHGVLAYSRIPVYKESMDDVTGFVLRYHILSAAGEGKNQLRLHQVARPIHPVPETVNVAKVLEEFIRRHRRDNHFGGRH